MKHELLADFMSRISCVGNPCAGILHIPTGNYLKTYLNIYSSSDDYTCQSRILTFKTAELATLFLNARTVQCFPLTTAIAKAYNTIVSGNKGPVKLSSVLDEITSCRDLDSATRAKFKTLSADNVLSKLSQTKPYIHFSYAMQPNNDCGEDDPFLGNLIAREELEIVPLSPSEHPIGDEFLDNLLKLHTKNSRDAVVQVARIYCGY